MFLNIIIMLLMVASVLCSIIVIRGKDKWEWLLGTALVSSKINMLIIVYALMTNKTFYLDIALVYIILSYIGITVLANYMLGRRSQK